MRITSSGSSDESEVTELGHLVLHNGRVITQFAAVILVVSSADGHHRPIRNFTERYHAEGHR